MIYARGGKLLKDGEEILTDQTGVKKDASNLTNENVESWKEKLNINKGYIAYRNNSSSYETISNYTLLLTNFSNKSLNGFSENDGHFTCNKSGKYYVSLTFSAEQSTNTNSRLSASIYILRNGETTHSELTGCRHLYESVNKVKPLTCNCIVELNEGDILRFYAQEYYEAKANIYLTSIVAYEI